MCDVRRVTCAGRGMVGMQRFGGRQGVLRDTEKQVVVGTEGTAAEEGACFLHRLSCPACIAVVAGGLLALGRPETPLIGNP